jgi:hypothetical protein
MLQIVGWGGRDGGMEGGREADTAEHGGLTCIKESKLIILGRMIGYAACILICRYGDCVGYTHF